MVIQVKKVLLLTVLLSGLVVSAALNLYLLSQLTKLEKISPQTDTPKFWHETCGYHNFGSMCWASMTPVTLPQSFKMSTIHLSESREVITLHTHYFGAQLNSGTKILFSINVTAPINFELVLVNRTEANIHALANEVAHFSRVIINAPQITSYCHGLNVQEKGLYIFVFDVIEPKPIATVTFKALCSS